MPHAWTLHTPRIKLRPIQPLDLDALERLWTTAAVRRPLFQGHLIARHTIEAEIEASAQSFTRAGFGQWAILPAAEDELMGFIGLRYAQDPPQLHLAGALEPSCWGAGYGAEATRTLLGYLFQALELPRVMAQTPAHNTRALYLMERVGMSFVRRHEIAGLSLVTYALERELYRPWRHATTLASPQGALWKTY